MSTEEKMKNSVLNGMCYYTIDNELMNFKKFFIKLEEKSLDTNFKIAVDRVLNKFREKWEEIQEFINKIPREDQSLIVITDVQKEFFIKSMKIRLNQIFDANI